MTIVRENLSDLLVSTSPWQCQFCFSNVVFEGHLSSTRLGRQVGCLACAPTLSSTDPGGAYLFCSHFLSSSLSGC